MTAESARIPTTHSDAGATGIPEGDDPVRVVAFGGGTGMSGLLRGLKGHTSGLTAIVTVTDNGGSSGRLRKEFDMVPPGDVRNCLVALADGEPLLSELLQYRFEESDLEGHSFGNLFITALTRVTGSFDAAVREMNRMLGVRGRVLPATGSKVSLIARHPDGTSSTGEVEVSASDKPVEKLEMRPRVGRAADDVLEAISSAEILLFGPGSLFTSIVPNLLVPGILEAISANDCERVYVANIMTQPGETNGLGLAEHVDAIETHAGQEFLTGVLVHDGPVPEVLEQKYRAEGAERVTGDLTAHRSRIRVSARDLLARDATVLRHDPQLLGRAIVEEFFPERATRARTATGGGGA